MIRQIFLSNRYGEIEAPIAENNIAGEWELRRYLREHGYEVADVSE